MADQDTVRRLALSMPDVEERPSYGTPAFFTKRKLFARLLDEDDCVVVKIEPGDRDRRMKADPDTFFITDHYQNYPMMIIRLSSVGAADLRELLNGAWQHATQ